MAVLAMAIKDLPPPIKTPDSGAGSWSQLLDWLVLVWKFVRTPALVLSPSGDAPTTPTGAQGDASLQIANDAFVQREIGAGANLPAMFGMASAEGSLSIIPSVISITTTFPALSGSRNLRGTVNVAAPLTKYDLTSADYLTLTDINNMPVVRSNIGLITNDLGVAGPTANGRDQAAVFPVSSWVYIYYIWNGTTLATISSLVAPPTGPTLPSGYTHWCFATSVRWNASSNIIPSFTKGSQIFYDVNEGGVIRILSSGTSATFSAVSCATLVPPNATVASLAFLNTISGGGVFIRPTGSTITLGMLVAYNAVQVNICNIPLGASSQFDYMVSSPASATIDIYGYTIPNGAC